MYLHIYIYTFDLLSCKNKHRSSLLNGCTDWYVATDLEHHFIFLSEIALMTQCPDIVICSVKGRCLWCNGYRRRKCTRQHEFKSWTRLIAFHIALILLGKV